MAPRLQLQSLLEGMAENVYFQPPSNTELKFPCIMYERMGSDVAHADNAKFRITKRYQVTVIDRNPDSTIPDAVEGLSRCSFDRFFIVGNLNHYVFSLYF